MYSHVEVAGFCVKVIVVLLSAASILLENNSSMLWKTFLSNGCNANYNPTFDGLFEVSISWKFKIHVYLSLKSIFTVSQPTGFNNKITRCRNRGCNIGPFTFKKKGQRFKKVKFVLWVEHFLMPILIKQNSFLFNQILLSTFIHNKNWEFEG